MNGLWDRVYITTLFTFHFDKIVETIRFYIDAVGGTVGKVFVGGIMASLMAEDIYRATNVNPIVGILHSPRALGLDDEGDIDIDTLPPDYSLLDPTIYRIHDTYYGYTTRGCTNCCPWCGVPRIEPKYQPYINIKPIIRELREQFGDKPNLRLMDNNVLASPMLAQIVQDLIELGYGRDEYTETKPRRQRAIDFNQGLDATFITDKTMSLIAALNIKPMRIAFDKVQEKKQYEKALELARSHGVMEFSNYMLYNFKDTPRNLYERLMVNIQLNEKWLKSYGKGRAAEIYSYPMRYAPINGIDKDISNKKRDAHNDFTNRSRDWLSEPVWTRRFMRNIEIMKGAAYGAISPTPSLAKRAIGGTYEEFIANLYMPEELLRNRNKHEKRVYSDEPTRKPGSGKVEEFRTFVIGLLQKQNKRFWMFHNAVSPNYAEDIRQVMAQTDDAELNHWLAVYLAK